MPVMLLQARFFIVAALQPNHGHDNELNLVIWNSEQLLLVDYFRMQTLMKRPVLLPSES